MDYETPSISPMGRSVEPSYGTCTIAAAWCVAWLLLVGVEAAVATHIAAVNVAILVTVTARAWVTVYDC